ncbi:type IV secretory system conjugative DNA transfer family protein [Streptomyces kaniharaensis]|uniref:type IV secretory system conjugative DNA transfer family protein n=1 Tax=Streptomyces kaniharaensis TaxID=212423 RepID=UPI0018A8122E|nr:type IV secretory system conjugative DNA transfer family protein [Streptomyces kaniharaensis]
MYIACEDTVLIFAPPRAGKSAWLGGQLIDAAGAVVATSTRADLYKLTHVLRRRDGRPVWVFNSDLEGVPNTIKWNPVRGCENPTIAIRRAGYMLSASAKGEAMANQSFWDSHSFTLLRNLMMAAALKGGTLLDVARWVSDPNNGEPLRIMKGNAHRVPQLWIDSLEQEMNAPDKTAAGVYMSLAPTLDFMSVPTVAQIVLPAPGEPEFSPYELLATQGTLYLMGEDRDRGSIAPLYSCLVAEVYEESKEWAKRAGGRLDPYIRFILDEAAIICPLPIHRWTSDAGGWNIHMEISAQSRSQLDERWGRTAAQTIYNNCNKLVLGGLTVPSDLEDLSMLVGDADQTVVSVSKDKDGKPTESHSIRRIRIMPPKDIREMKVGNGLYLHRAVAPIKVTYLPTWKRKDVKESLREEKKALKLQRKEQKLAAKQGTVDLVKQPVPVPAPVMPSAPPAMPVPTPAAPPVQQPAPAATVVFPPPLPNYSPEIPAQQPAAAPAEAPAEQPRRRAVGDGTLPW